MGLFDGKVAVITGAGRGIGREHALLFAREGASVVVNDLGGDATGAGADATPAQDVVAEITATGGAAVVNGDDVASWSGAEALIRQAVDAFGRLDVLVNNAGILRDRMSFNMDEAEWDDVIKVHLKGHFAPSRFAAAHWRERSKATGGPVGAAIVNTSSGAGLYGNAGQANYAAAKAGIASMTIAMARELERIGVRVNAVAPVARTRLLGAVTDGGPVEDGPLDPMGPQNVAAVAAWLASDLAADVNGQVVWAQGGVVQLLGGWRPVGEIRGAADWTVEELAARREELFGDQPSTIPPALFPMPE